MLDVKHGRVQKEFKTQSGGLTFIVINMYFRN